MSKRQKVDLLDLLLTKDLDDFERELDRACESSQDNNFLLSIADKLNKLQDIVGKKSVVPVKYDRLDILADDRTDDISIDAWCFQDKNVEDFKADAENGDHLALQKIYNFLKSGHRFQTVKIDSTTPMNPTVVDLVALLFDEESKGSVSELVIECSDFDLHEHSRFDLYLDFSSLKRLCYKSAKFSLSDAKFIEQCLSHSTCTSLQTLQLEHCTISNTDASVIADAIIYATSLCNLTLSFVKFEDDEFLMHELPRAINRESLRCIKIVPGVDYSAKNLMQEVLESDSGEKQIQLEIDKVDLRANQIRKTWHDYGDYDTADEIAEITFDFAKFLLASDRWTGRIDLEFWTPILVDWDEFDNVMSALQSTNCQVSLKLTGSDEFKWTNHQLDQVLQLACSSKRVLKELFMDSFQYYPSGFEKKLVSRVADIKVPRIHLQNSLCNVPGFWEALEDNYETTDFHFFHHSVTMRQDKRYRFHCALNKSGRQILTKEKIKLSLWPLVLKRSQSKYYLPGERHFTPSCTYYLLRNGLDQILSN